MPFFTFANYPEQKVPVDIDIVKFLSSEENTAVALAGTWSGSPFAINYRDRGSQASAERAFVGDGGAYFIDFDGRKITYRRGRNPFLGPWDKIKDPRVMFEGTVDQFLQLFVTKGFDVVP